MRLWPGAADHYGACDDSCTWPSSRLRLPRTCAAVATRSIDTMALSEKQLDRKPPDAPKSPHRHWLLLRNIESNGERNRTLFVRKSRGMPHSNQVREFVLSDKGIDLVDVYLGADRVLTGSARVAQEAQERAAAAIRGQDHQRKLRQLASRRKAIEAQIAALKAEAEAQAEEVQLAMAQESSQQKTTHLNTDALAQQRRVANGLNGRLKEKR